MVGVFTGNQHFIVGYNNYVLPLAGSALKYTTKRHSLLIHCASSKVIQIFMYSCNGVLTVPWQNVYTAFTKLLHQST